MTDPRKPIFDAVKAAMGANPFNDRNSLALFDATLTAIGVPVVVEGPKPTPKPKEPHWKSGRPMPPPMPRTGSRPAHGITVNMALELLKHEGIVREAYLDSVGVWTWGVGITKASGIDPLQYKDNPATVNQCLHAYLEVLANKYAPAVEIAFAPIRLSEAEFAAAVSFHYNTGAIHKASWVKQFKKGNVEKSRRNMMLWTKAGGKTSQGLVNRREKERDLFFDGEWSRPETVMMWGVTKPGYRPVSGRRMSVKRNLERLLGA